MLEIIIVYKFCIRKTSREVITWRPRQGWWNYIETDPTETECEGDDRICISQWQVVCYGNKALVVKQIECLIDKLREYYLWKKHFAPLNCVGMWQAVQKRKVLLKI